MTNDMMNLRALMEKSPDADLLRELIGYAAQRLMELEVGGLTGAAHGEKSADRLVHGKRWAATLSGRWRFQTTGLGRHAHGVS